jgi:NAD(P)H-dependent flavin oxidoreductase YrpB (nitropropane dioxygenase family)
MPLQGMVTVDAIQRTHRYADKAQSVAFNPVGQVVGMMNEVRSVRDLMYQLAEEYLEATDRLQSLNADA